MSLRKMINFLKIKPHKCFNGDVFLLDLGKINILTGKNNSGKTTILEAITDKKHSCVGLQLDTKGLNALFEIYKEASKHITSPSKQYLHDWFNRILKEMIGKSYILYQNSVDEFIQSIRERKEQDKVLSQYSDLFFIEDSVNRFYQKIFEKFPISTILIPPKRKLEANIEINFEQQIASDGAGITNSLFYLKNQALNSQEFLLYGNISTEFERITGYTFNVVPDKNNKISVYFSKNEQDWIKSTDSGQGMSEVLIIVSTILIKNSDLTCIEEPENHLHPELQRRLLDFISKTNNQYILSTHSNIFLNTDKVDKIYFLELKDNLFINDATSKTKVLEELGYSKIENLVADVVILTEVPSDIVFLKTILTWIELINKYSICYWSLGGDIMDQQDMTIFSERKNVIALIDKDVKSAKVRKRFAQLCKSIKIPCHQLKRYAIENYLTLDAIKKVYPEIQDSVSSLEPNIKVDKQLWPDTERSLKKQIKKILEYMSLSDIQDTDLYIDFISKVKEICERSCLPNHSSDHCEITIPR